MAQLQVGQPAGRGSTLWVIVITSVAGFITALDNLIVTTALPSIREDLGGNLEDLEWTVSAYTLAFAVLVMFGASLGDRFGRRRMFILGLGIFTAASVAAALAPGMNELIAARAVQGVGSAIVTPLTLTLLSAAVPAERRGAALGVWGAASGIAVAMGPLIGGTLTQHLSWQWIFWVNVPIGLALIPVSLLKLKESHGPNQSLDLIGTALASGGLFGIIYALVRGNADGWTSAPILGGLIGGAVLLIAFVRYELRTEHPMLPMRLFRHRSFSAINIASLLMFLGMFGAIFLLSQYLQLVGGYSPIEAGVRMLPWTAMPMIAGPLAGVLSDRVGGGPVVAVGMALNAVGLALWALAVEPDASYTSLLPALIVCGIGMGMFFAPSANLVMSTVRPEEQGIASGANNAIRELGGAIGVASLAAVFSSQGGYGSPAQFVDGLTPALWVGSGAVAVAAALAFSMPRKPKADNPTANPAAAAAGAA
ncbi:DHA2 family efflux MFS transporter permease subunit [Streptomyces turgidiscabies]|uniref:Drug resistance MFS transporter, drug:H+ antiporter-2 (14 Spanner) (DHA2) family protein n=1 Tax=Streptomyces turgidiscabies (strain Car8) TaxID=698760 RepID=L7ESV3_STRT8|nr:MULTISPECIES: DHA2 family efflux MFS transporter permease subunit [Streptomyces]ELP61974.1 drug resistance MFS transporter, drug:H+ antiporter-2 (14 Spanner) (DHA2) family protein [Streptomyces turgidiscabies Car8]MDX3496716.1 DHA2 family efflux MFS transporter permease subunit [Streptomyces turgidiscabies]GAQ74178.1 multidrug resistance protein stp [Streptomyces turgidiscabies]